MSGPREQRAGEAGVMRGRPTQARWRTGDGLHQQQPDVRLAYTALSDMHKKHLKNEWQRGEEKGEEGGKEGERKRIAEGGGRSLHGLLLT